MFIFIKRNSSYYHLAALKHHEKYAKVRMNGLPNMMTSFLCINEQFLKHSKYIISP